MYDLQRRIYIYTVNGEAYRLECAHGTMDKLHPICWIVSMVP